MTLAEELRAWIEKNERSASYIARQIGCSSFIISRWINHGTSPGGRLGLRLHRLTGIPLDVIFAEKKGAVNGK